MASIINANSLNDRGGRRAVNRRRSLFLLLFCLSTLACGERESDTPIPFEPETQGTASEQNFEATGRFATLRVVAMWVKNLDTAHIFTDPEDDWFIQQTFMYLVSDWAEDQRSVTIREQVCHVDLTVIGGLDTLPGPKLVEALTMVELQGSLSSTETWSELKTTAYADIWGAQLADPLSDSLPEEPSDSTEWDQDQDGNPGATIELVVDESGSQFGFAYISQRVVFELDGQIVGPDAIEGFVEVLGAEQYVMDSPQAYIRLAEPEVKPVDDKSLSFFQSVRVEPGFDCQELLKSDVRNALFPGFASASPSARLSQP